MAAAVKPPSILLPSSSPIGAGKNPVVVPNDQAQPQAPVASPPLGSPPANGNHHKSIFQVPAAVAHAMPEVKQAQIEAAQAEAARAQAAQVQAAQAQAQAAQAKAAQEAAVAHGASRESLATNSVPPLSPGGSQSSTLASSIMTDGSWDDAESNTSTAGGQVTPRSSMAPSPSPKIRFGNCPERPPELRRRNSITLGVLARKSMLHAQGTAGPGGTRVVNMTDEEWEAYQSKFNKNQQAPVDLGRVVSSGAKKFWGKVRRGSNTSVGSGTSSTGRGRSDSASSLPGMPVSPLVKPVDVAPAIEEHEEEEEHAHLPPRMRTPPPGEETPRVGRSPSPPPHRVFDEEEDEDEDESSEEGEHREPDEGHGLDDADHVHRMRHSNSVAALGFEIGDYKRKGAFASRGSRQSLRSLLLEEEENDAARQAAEAHAQSAPIQNGHAAPPQDYFPPQGQAPFANGQPLPPNGLAQAPITQQAPVQPNFAQQVPPQQAPVPNFAQQVPPQQNFAQQPVQQNFAQPPHAY